MVGPTSTGSHACSTTTGRGARGWPVDGGPLVRGTRPGGHPTPVNGASLNGA